MRNQNLGTQVRVVFSDKARAKGLGNSVIYRNVTEIHYNYPTALKVKKIAFESGIHGTGLT